MNPNHCHSRMRGPLGKPAAAAFHIAVRTLDKTCQLGRQRGAAVELTYTGKLAEQCWHELPAHFAGVVPDAIAVLPTRIEGLLFLPAGASERTLDLVVGAFKSAVSACLGRSIWEAGYEQHAVADTASLNQVRSLILEPPPACAA